MATVINGNKIAAEIRKKLTKKVETLDERLPGFRPGVAMVQVGNDESCNVYSQQSQKAAVDIGIVVEVIRLPASTDLRYLSKRIEKLNADPDVHGIIILLPLSNETIDVFKATNVILPRKDVEGVTAYNETLLRLGKLDKCTIPCDAEACLKLIEKTGVSIKGKKAVVLGKEKINGIPISELLKFKGADVSNYDRETPDLQDKSTDADILVAALDEVKIVKESWVKKGAVVIDCGFHKKDGKIAGDVDFEEVKKVAGCISRVPGGMGPVIVAMLMKNTVDLAERALDDRLNNCACCIIA